MHTTIGTDFRLVRFTNTSCLVFVQSILDKYLKAAENRELKSIIKFRDVAGGPGGKAAGKFLIHCRPTCGRDWN